MDFDYCKPIGYQPLRWTVEDDDTFMRPRYDMYNLSDTITIGELMEILFDTWNWDNNQLYHSKKDEFNDVYGQVLDLFEPAIRSEQLKVVKLIRPDWDEGWIPIWEVELSQKSAANWVKNKNLIELIESTGIKVAHEFKDLLDEAVKKGDSPDNSKGSNKDIPKPNSFLPVGSGVSWSDITITLIDKDTVDISIKDKKDTYNFASLGFLNKTTKSTPKKAWWILVLFIKENGCIDSKSDHHILHLTEEIKGFKTQMKNIFGIDEQLIPHYKKSKGWKVNFKTIDKTKTDFKNICLNAEISQE